MPDTPKNGKDKGGAPKGNINAGRHYMLCGKLPKELKYVELRINAFKRNLEGLVLDAKGSISVSDASLIDVAARWERHSNLALAYLRREGSTLKPAERLSYSEATAKGATHRDKAIQSLGLDTKPLDPWAIAVESEASQ